MILKIIGILAMQIWAQTRETERNRLRSIALVCAHFRNWTRIRRDDACLRSVALVCAHFRNWTRIRRDDACLRSVALVCAHLRSYLHQLSATETIFLN